MTGSVTGSVIGAARSRAAGLLLGAALDRVVPDPARWHPVAGFGTVAAALERRLWADSRPRGVVHVAVLVGGVVGPGLVAERLTRRHPAAHVLATAAATWVVLGGASLEREARAVTAHLDGPGGLPGARQRLTHLVGRDTASLSAGEVVRAVVESVAENTSDAVVAPLVWGAVAGVPGLLGHRAANTLDAMVGHRSPRHARYGWAAARLDDLLNLPGARLTALLATGLGPDHRGAWTAWRRDAADHPSPNAGPVEAAFAGALGLRLGGTNTYRHQHGERVEHRALMGHGRAPEPGDEVRAVVLARRVDLAAALVAAVAAAGVPAVRVGWLRAPARARRRRGAPRRSARRRAG